jgi:type IV fimbrial biogenesis protein FimT
VHTRHFYTRGFTLIESLFVVAIIGTLAALADVSLIRMVRSSELQTSADTLFVHLMLARNEAVTRNTRLVMCKSSSGARCDNSGGWEQGWIVFHDANENVQLDSNERIVSVVQRLPSHLRVAGNSSVDSYVSFVPSGRAVRVSGAYQMGTITICSAVDASLKAKQLIIGNSGRVRTETVTVQRC